jgi:hypothetical protein
MQTRSSNSPPQSVTSSSQQGPQGASASGEEAAIGSTPTAPAPTNKHGQWSVEEESELIAFLYERKAEAGDGAGFKQSTWTAAAARMSAKHPGVIYNTNQCSGKWGRVRPHILTLLLLLSVV